MSSNGDKRVILTLDRNQLRDKHGQWHCNFIIFPRSLWDFQKFSIIEQCLWKERRHFSSVLFDLAEWLEVLAGILGYLITLQCYFQCCFYKGSLLWLYKPWLQKRSVNFSDKTFSAQCCFYKGSLLWLYAFAVKTFFQTKKYLYSSVAFGIGRLDNFFGFMLWAQIWEVNFSENFFKCCF